MARGNIHDDNYSIVHWRAERKNIHYIECAERVVNVKRSIGDLLPQGTAEGNDHKFLVMTSLDEDESKEWNGSILRDIAAEDTGTPKVSLRDASACSFTCALHTCVLAVI